MELAADFVELGVVFQNNSVNLYEFRPFTIFIGLILKNVKLVELLLRHNQIFASNYGQIFFFRALLHG